MRSWGSGNGLVCPMCGHRTEDETELEVLRDIYIKRRKNRLGNVSIWVLLNCCECGLNFLYRVEGDKLEEGIVL